MVDEIVQRFTDFVLSAINDNFQRDLEKCYNDTLAEIRNLKQLKQGRQPSSQITEVIVKTERKSNLSDPPKGKENVSDKDSNPPQPKRVTRCRALKEAQIESNVAIKEEKLSNVSAQNIMPPPQQPVRKGRTRNQAAKPVPIKVERESDVILQPAHISIITLSDSDDDNAPNKTIEKPKEKPVRSTRTKTRAIAKSEEPNGDSTKNGEKIAKNTSEDAKVNETFVKSKTLNEENELLVKSNDVDDNKSVRSTRTKTRAKAAKETAKRVSEEMKTTFEVETTKRVRSPSPFLNENKRQKSFEAQKSPDETYIKTPQKPPIANETVILTKDNRQIVTTPLNKQVPVDDLLTDDEDETYNVPPKSKVIASTTKKPMFSQYDSSPVKKRVEAFEKLGAELANRAQTTSKKTKPRQKDSNIPTVISKGQSQSKLKQFTPLKSSTLMGSSTASKVLSGSKSGLKNTLPAKTISALKTSQQEYIEREARRKEKEAEAARKKEALMLAKQEELRRKNEEKKVQQQQKLAQLKAQQEAEQLERLKQKQALLKETQKKQERKVRPAYLDRTAPLLPVGDCLDSDDDQDDDKPRPRPEWTKQKNLYPILKKMYYCGTEITNTFFMRQATTPDLETLMGSVSSNKLQRTSSAVWHKPPRFTLMPIPPVEERVDEDDPY